MRKAIRTGPATIKSLLIGAGVGLLVLAAGSALAAMGVYFRKLPEQSIRYCAWAVAALSAFAGSMTAQRQMGKANLAVSLICALVLLLCMVLLRFVLTDGKGWSWYCAAVMCLAAAASSFFMAGRKNRRI